MSGDVHVRFCESAGVSPPRATLLVVVCQDQRQAQEALELVRRVLETDLGLSLSPEKTKITTYGWSISVANLGCWHWRSFARTEIVMAKHAA